jgi:hypothetical protein
MAGFSLANELFAVTVVPGPVRTRATGLSPSCKRLMTDDGVLLHRVVLKSELSTEVKKRQNSEPASCLTLNRREQ